MRSIMLCDATQHPKRVYPSETWELLQEIAGLEDSIYKLEDILANPDAFLDVDFLFSTWGMPGMTEEQIQRVFPNVKCLFYAAGSVQGFARPFLNCGIKVFSAWGANGVPVAEYTLAQILLANTGYFHTFAAMSSGNPNGAHSLVPNFPGNYDVSVGIIGAGMIGKMVIKLLKNFNINVMAYSIDLTDEKAAELGVKNSTIEEIFAGCQVVSNHLANLPQTVGMLKKEHFASMLPYATFINTGRGAQIVEADMIEVLTQRPDLVAVLDVTHPEPPVENSPLYSLPNCIITPHIAGSLGNEVRRMSKYMVAEFNHYIQGEPCQYEVTTEMLQWMA